MRRHHSVASRRPFPLTFRSHDLDGIVIDVPASPNQAVDDAVAPFIQARRLGRLAYLVGAGVSKDPPANRPLASEIARALAAGLWNISDVARQRLKEETVCRRSASVRFESLVQIVADTTGSVGFLRVLRGGRPNVHHRMLARALRDRCPVLTTNFDQLIERALRGDAPATVLKWSNDFRVWRRRSPRGVLAKLHGSIEDLDSLCATLRQVGSLGLAFMWNAARGEYLASVRRDYPMVIVGYSGFDDSDILPRLRITESDRPLLWVIHNDSALHIANHKHIERHARARGLADYLRESQAVTLIGRTSEAMSLLEERRPISLAAASAEPEPALRERLVSQMKRTTVPHLADFLIARMMHEGGFRRVSRAIFRDIRRGVGQQSPGLVARCMVNEATVATDLGDWKPAARLLDAALPRMKRWADPRAFLNACLDRALVHRHLGESEKAEASLRAMIRELGRSTDYDQELARARANLADVLFENERHAEIRGLLKKARVGFKRVGDHNGMAMVFGVYGKSLFARGELADAISLLEMALMHYRIAWDRTGEARILNNLGTMLRVAGRLDAAVESFDKACGLAKALADPEPGVVSEMGLVTVDIAAGRLDTAVARAKACLPIAKKLGLFRLALQTTGNLAIALMQSGQTKEALPLFEDILPSLATAGPANQLALTLRNIGACHAASGQLGTAANFLAKAAQLYRDLGMESEASEANELREKCFH